MPKNEDDILENTDDIKENFSASPDPTKDHGCPDEVRKLCTRELEEDDVKCPMCGNKSLKLIKYTKPNPWVRVECRHSENGRDCGLVCRCGYAVIKGLELDPPTATTINKQTKKIRI